uniref:Uncharacterized protein n=1 Tax=Vibrio tasmaniensis TaxID=212663 RepID=A0A0H3ZTQ6_9VIBR|nr:hypothetical protein [Vibrio tasmaniensis]
MIANCHPLNQTFYAFVFALINSPNPARVNRTVGSTIA